MSKYWKKVLSLMLAICMVCSMIVLPVSAAEGGVVVGSDAPEDVSALPTIDPELLYSVRISEAGTYFWGLFTALVDNTYTFYAEDSAYGEVGISVDLFDTDLNFMYGATDTSACFRDISLKAGETIVVRVGYAGSPVTGDILLIAEQGEWENPSDQPTYDSRATDPSPAEVSDLPVVEVNAVNAAWIVEGGQKTWVRFVAPYTGEFELYAWDASYGEAVINVGISNEMLHDTMYSTTSNYNGVFSLAEGEVLVLSFGYDNPTYNQAHIIFSLNEVGNQGGGSEGPSDMPVYESSADAPTADTVADLPKIPLERECFARINQPGEQVHVSLTAPHSGIYTVAAMDITNGEAPVSLHIQNADLTEGSGHTDTYIEQVHTWSRGETSVLSLGYDDPNMTGEIVFVVILQSEGEVPDFENMPVLNFGQKTPAMIPEAQGSAWFTFTPEEDGVYMFRSLAPEGSDTEGILYDSSFSRIAEDDDSGEWNNFMIPCKLTAGQTYIFAAKYLWDDSTASFPVIVEKSPVIDVSIDTDLYVYENTMGNYQTWDGLEFFRYNDWRNVLNYTVTLADGTTESGTGSAYHYGSNDLSDGLTFEFYEWYSEQTSYDPWELGETNPTIVQFLGTAYDLNVHIIAAPSDVVIHVDPAMTCWSDMWGEENSNGEYVEYTHYEWLYNVLGTVTIDGNTYWIQDGGFEYQGVWYQLWTKDDQSPDNQWHVGETRTGTVGIMNAEATVSIDVMDNVSGGDGPNIDASEAPPLAEMAVLTLDETSIADIPYGGASAWYSFTPAESGTYSFYSDAKADTWGAFYDSNRNPIAQDDESYGNGDFRIVADLEAGETYIFRARFWDNGSWGSFPVCIVRGVVEGGGSGGDVPSDTPVENLDQIPVLPLDSYTDAEISTGGQTAWFRFTPEETGVYTFRSYAGDGMDPYGALYDDCLNELISNDDSGSLNFQITCELEAGKTYILAARLLDDRQTGFIPVLLESSPVAGITIHGPVTVMEDTDGWIQEDHNGTYFWYDILKNLSFTVSFKDGTSYTGTGRAFVYNDQIYTLTAEDNQSPDSPWTAGNTYDATVRYGNISAPVQVIVEESPIASVVFDDITVYQGIHSAMHEGWNDQTGEHVAYEHYYWWDAISYTVTMKDGTVISGHGSGFNYNETWHEFSFWDEQGPNNSLQVGNSYPCTVAYGTQKSTIQVSVEPFPIASIEIQDITLEEFENGGYWEGEDEHGNMTSYFHYWWPSLVQGTVHFTDGTSCALNGMTFEFQGNSYSLDWYDSQSASNPWLPGNTYTATVGYGDITTNVNINITNGPIESITFEPVFMVSEEDGYWDYDGSSSFYYYPWWNNLHYTVTFSDGTVVSGNGTYIYNPNTGKDYSIDCDDNQYDLHWFAGNTYEATARIAGTDYPIAVTISHPVSSDGYTYLVQNGCVIINGCNLTSSTLNIPDTLGGYPVTGITSLGDAAEYVQNVIIPDSVTMLGSDLMWNAYYLRSITIGSGITNLTWEMLASYSGNLEEILVSEDNAVYCSVDGVLYDKAKTTIIAYPPSKTSMHTVPATVTDIEFLFNGRCSGINVDLSNCQTKYIQQDGVIYSPDMTTILLCNGNKTGKYDMPDSVTAIADQAFMNSSLEEVIISDNVTNIVYHSFYGSKNLVKVTMPDTVESIGYYAFGDCTNLKELNSNASSATNLPSSLETLSGGAFARTALSGTANIPATVAYVGGYSFYGTNLTNVVLNEGTVSIDGYAFSNTKITSVDIPDSVEEIYSGAFSGCHSLKQITFGSGLYDTGSSTFSNCTALESVYLPATVQIVGTSAFSGCSALKEVTFGGDEISIMDSAFSRCPIAEIDLPAATYMIQDYAFYGSGLTAIDIPESVARITYKSFADSTSLLTIDVPETLYNLDGYAFHNTAWYNSQPDGPVYLEDNLYGYKGEMPENYALTIADGTTLVADQSFCNLDNLTSLNIPASVEYIPGSAFRGNANLQTVNVSGSNYYMDGNILRDADGDSVWGAVTDVSMSAYYIQSIYKLGEKFNIGSAYAEIEHADGWTSWILLDNSCVKGYDPMKIGTQDVTIVYGGQVLTHILVEVIADIDYLEIVDPRTEYDLNQAWRYDNMKVIAHVGNQSFVVDDYVTEGFDTSTPGEKTVTVIFQNVQAEYTITVNGEKTSIGSQTPAVDSIVDPETGDTVEIEYNIEVSVDNSVADAEDLVLTVETIDLEENLDEGAEPPLILQNSTNSVVFDIKLTDTTTGEPVVADEETPLTVSIPVPSHMNGEDCLILYVAEDGSYVDMQAIFDGSHMVFTTPHFSYYALVESDVPFVAQIGNAKFTTVYEALKNATAGDVVTLLDDVNESNRHLTIDEGVTLDLAGYDLTAKSLNALNGGLITGTRYGNEGHSRVFVAKNRLSLTDALVNGQNLVIPYWDPNDGCYVLANTRIKDVDNAFNANEETKTISFRFSYGAGSAANADFLIDGADDNALSVVVRLQWESENGVAYQDFVYKNEYVMALANSGGNFTFELTGYDILNIDLDTFSITGMILSDSGIVVSGTEYTQGNTLA